MSAGSIVIDLLANTGSFITDMKRAKGSLKKFSVVAKAASGTVSAVGAALTAMVQSHINAIDNLANKANMIGTSTEKLSALRYAAEQMAAVGSGTFDNALRRMTRRIHEASEGTGPAAKALEQLGLNARELAQLMPDEQFKRLADAMKAAENQGLQLSTTMKIFDTEGMPLVNMLREGGAAIAEMEAEAAQLALTVDGHTAAAAQRFASEIDTLNRMKQSFTNQLTAELLPSLLALSSHFKAGSDGAERMGHSARVAATGMKLLGSVVAIVGNLVKMAANALGALVAAALALARGDGLNAASGILKDGFEDAVETLRSSGRVIKNIWNDVEPPADLPQRLAAPIDTAMEHIEASSERSTNAIRRHAKNTDNTYQQVEATLQRLRVQIDGFSLGEDERKVFELQVAGADPEQLERYRALLAEMAALTQAREAETAAQQQQAQAQGVLERLNEEIAVLGLNREELEKRNALMQAGVEAESEMGQAISATVDKLQQQRSSLAEQVAAMDAFRTSASTAFADVLSGTNSLKDALGNFLDELNQRLMKMITDKLIERAFGGLGTAGGGAMGGGFAGMIGGLFGGGRTSGGDVSNERSYLIGERGPELFVPRTSGRILNTDQTRALASPGGGRSVQQTLNVKIEGRPDRGTPEQLARAAGRNTQRALSRAG